jgi:hypothetical protein
VGPDPAKLDAISLADKKRWTVALHEDRIELQPEEGASSDIYRDGLTQKIHVPGLMLGPRMLLFEVSQRVLLKFDPAGFARLWAWLGDARDGLLRTALRERFKWSFPIGLIIAYLYLPTEASGVVEHLHFGLGATLVVSAIASTAVPRPWFFLLDSAWFAVLAGLTVYDIVRGTSPFWLLAVLLQVGLVAGGVSLYRMFSEAPSPSAS